MFRRLPLPPLAPPALHRGRTALDRALFTLDVPLKALRVRPADCQWIIKRHGSALLGLPRFRSVLPAADDASARLMLLRRGTASADDLPDELRGLVADGKASLVEHTITLDYNYWSSDQLLGAVLPEDAVVPTSFETVGHIAHVNLRDEQLPFKQLIGQVLLDKNRNIRTVVNKLDAIDAQFRFFQMEVLAGDNNTVAEVRENGCTFRFDFAKVYWNSRLYHEHQRLVGLFGAGEVVVDAFAGVGPFALPAARKGCVVLANDLNPQSHEALESNVQLNKLTGKVRCLNLDARAFLRQVLRERHSADAAGKLAHHVVMNLPATAIEFLDAFVGLFADVPQLLPEQLPTVHVHCFSHEIKAPDADVLARIEAAMGARPALYTLHRVRSVAPNKDMLCCSFALPLAVVHRAGKRTASAEDSSEPEDTKHARVDPPAT
eukprot:Unigene4463_Nuclearia_a/m.13635 Unigene4463_Nuclearia_a/g.13635  ORF Unigene4463_Nuclearia_a/g.13635 Unigene4463_Nuclearia_a/m.13635 type:complete len:434 (-) Unigene4463_Nuclearia_a:77-1378(-)